MRWRGSGRMTTGVSSPRTVFRFYLPLARGRPNGAVGAIDVERAAKPGLADAGLAWPRKGGRGFEAHAQVVLAAQLHHLSPIPRLTG